LAVELALAQRLGNEVVGRPFLAKDVERRALVPEGRRPGLLRRRPGDVRELVEQVAIFWPGLVRDKQRLDSGADDFKTATRVSGSDQAWRTSHSVRTHLSKVESGLSG
jgi:hypothetical protein